MVIAMMKMIDLDMEGMKEIDPHLLLGEIEKTRDLATRIVPNPAEIEMNGIVGQLENHFGNIARANSWPNFLLVIDVTLGISTFHFSILPQAPRLHGGF